MAIFNFKVTEDDRPGGGVYKLGTPDAGTNNVWTIKPSDFPNVNLSSLTADNFFKRTTCNASPSASVSAEYGNNAAFSYHGGNTSISYQFSNGVGIVTINEDKRYAYMKKYPAPSGSYQAVTQYGTYTHTMYMSKNKVV